MPPRLDDMRISVRREPCCIDMLMGAACECKMLGKELRWVASIITPNGIMIVDSGFCETRVEAIREAAHCFHELWPATAEAE